MSGERKRLMRRRKCVEINNKEKDLGRGDGGSRAPVMGIMKERFSVWWTDFSVEILKTIEGKSKLRPQIQRIAACDHFSSDRKSVV